MVIWLLDLIIYIRRL